MADRACTCDRIPPPGEPFTDQYCARCWLWHSNSAYREEIKAIDNRSLLAEQATEAPWSGAGAKLKEILRPLGFKTCGKCAILAAEMDRRGPAWCRGNRAHITSELLQRGREQGIMEDVAKIGGTEGDVQEFLNNIVDEACRQAEDEALSLTKGTLYVQMTSNGIGDHFMGLTTCAGLKRDNPGKRVVYGVRCDPRWMLLFDAADVVVRALPTVVRLLPDQSSICRPYDFHLNNVFHQPRWIDYARRCNTTAVVPKLRPLPEHVLTWAQPYAGAVVMCPFAYHESRRWPIESWIALEQRLLDDGSQVVIIGGPNCDNEPFQTPHKFKNESPPTVAALLLGARMFVGNDSGMTHLAGLIGTPSLAVTPGYAAHWIFGIFPSVRVMSADPISSITVRSVCDAMK